MASPMQKVNEITSAALAEYLGNRKDGRLVGFFPNDPTNFNVAPQQIWVNTTNNTLKYTDDGGQNIYDVSIRDDLDFVNVKWFGAKGDGTTDDTAAIQTAINVASLINSAVYIPPTLAFYRLTAGITIDCTKTSLEGKNTILSFGGMTSGKAVTVTGTGSYTVMYKNVRKAISGILIRGGPQGSSIPVIGLFIGTDSALPKNDNINNLSIEDFVIDGFQTALEFGHNAWRIHILNGMIRWGIVNVPAGLQNFGENMVFNNVLVGDNGAQVVIGAGNFHFYGCSFDNCRVRSIGDSVIHINGCHFENPGSSNPGYRMISLEHDESAVFVDGTDFFLNQPSGGGPFNQSLMSVLDTILYKGLHLSNLRLFEANYYEPTLTDPNKTLVNGNGRVTYSGAMVTNHNFSDYVIASYMGLLYNQGGETGNTNGWTTTAGATGTFSYDSTTFKNGTGSLKLTTNVNQFIEVYQELPVTPGKLLLTQSWIKYNINGATSQFYFQTQLYFYARNGVQISSDGFSNRTTTSDWVIKTNNVIVPTGAVTGRIAFRLSGGSTGTTSEAWFDDVIVNMV